MHETSTPHEILRWAGQTFGDDLVVTASFGDAVLAHLANSVLPGVDIVLLDTGYLFAETEWYADDLRRRFGLNLRTVHPLPDVEPRRVADRHQRLLRGPQGRATPAGAER